jgi:hypothetical protein
LALIDRHCLTQTQTPLCGTGSRRVVAAAEAKIQLDFFLARSVIRPLSKSGKYQYRHCNHDSLYIGSIEMIEENNGR